MVHQVTIDGVELTFNRPSLAIANNCWPFVLNSMTRMSFGNFNVFSDVTPSMIEVLQKAVCSTTTIVSEDKLGVKVRRYLELDDLEELNHSWPLILGTFLEHGFGLFSKFQVIQKLLLLGTTSEDGVEKEKPLETARPVVSSTSEELPLF